MGVAVGEIYTSIIKKVQQPHYISLPEDIPAVATGDDLYYYTDRDTLIYEYKGREENLHPHLRVLAN